MDKLFSNIQQNFSSLQNKINQDGNKTLLQKQQISQDKINELLEQSSQAIMCGPECQKIKVTEELKQKYLDAETNVQTAPIKLEESKKNYYIYSEGRPYYDNMKEEDLKKKVESISQLLKENFNTEVSSANTMNTYLNTALVNSENSEELLEEYVEKNRLLKLKLRERHGDILTNDRKTYYEKEASDKLVLWYKFFLWIYYIIVVMLVLALIMVPSNLTMVKKVMIAILCIFYPYYINYIVKWVYNKYVWIQSKIPKNVYNNL